MAIPDRVYRLLVVDDDASDRRLYAKLLGQRPRGGFELEQFLDGTTGLAALRERKFDCVLLDFSLPDMTGLEFLTRAAADDGEQPCAIVLVTGQGNEAVAVEAMKRGARDYLTKDRVGAGSLSRAIIQAVTQTELRQRLATSLRDRERAIAALEREMGIREAAEIELRAAKDTAEQANLAKTRFVAMVTHELRTPLNGVLGYAELLRIEGNLSARQTGRVDAMMRAGRHLRDMIESVLDFASIESGRMELNLAPIVVRELIEECVAIIRPIAADRALRLVVAISPDVPRRIVADMARLRQILINLLGNAIKFTREGGVELRVLAGTLAAGLRIEVADTGPGIDPADRDRLFQDFERFGASVAVEGTGLGLAITARIVALMGGTIGYAANPGGGSVFSLELPAAATDMVPPPPAAAAVHNATPSGRRLLLVDDVEMNLDIMGAFLRAAGHAVTLAGNGHDAIRIASETMFDLILMDVCMPEPDGLEATRMIRELPAPFGQVPILALTAQSFAEQRARCRDAGMNGHIAKPVEYATLMRAITETTAHSAAGLPGDWPTGEAVAFDAHPPPQLDRAVLDETLAFLSPAEITGHLRLLRARQELMLRLLDQPADPASLTEAAHVLASTAGMFGLTALSAVSRQFEHAMARDMPKSDQPADQVRSETQAALAILAELMRETRMQIA